MNPAMLRPTPRRGSALAASAPWRRHAACMSALRSIMEEQGPDLTAEYDIELLLPFTTDLPNISSGKFQPEFHDLTPDQQSRLDALLAKHSGAFSQHAFDIGSVHPSIVTHSITTPYGTSGRPRHWKARRHAKAQEDSLKMQCEELVKHNIIRLAPMGGDNTFVAQAVMIKKPDGTWRLTLDYRELNAVTLPERYIMPDAATLLRKFADCDYFSILDYTQGFWNIHMNPDDIHKTKFVTPFGMYEWLRMPMGLLGSPATQQKLTDHVLADVEHAEGFIDDVFMGDVGFEQALKTLDHTLTNLEANQLKAKLAKSYCMCRRLKALGHIVSKNSIEADTGHIELIRNLPAPTNRAGVASLLGMTGYWADHIPYYAQITTSIRSLLSEKTPFVWGPNQRAEFDTLKTILLSAPVLRPPDWRQPFRLTTDWSKLAMGAVLSQIDPVTGLEYAISYASRSSNTAESRYSATRGECKALEWAVEKYRYYLYGHFFKVRTDHQALKYMRTADFQDAAVHRWVLKLQEYDFEAEHTPGSENKVADYMSRGARRIEQTFSVPPASPLPEPIPVIPTSTSRANSTPPPSTPSGESDAEAVIPRLQSTSHASIASSPSPPCLHSIQHILIKAPRGRAREPKPDSSDDPAFSALFRSRSHNRGIPDTPAPHSRAPDIAYAIWSTAISAQSLQDVGQSDPAQAAVTLTMSHMRRKIADAHARSEIPDEAACPICLQTDATRQMLACDGCNQVFHTHCLPPPHDGIPSGPWYCRDCSPDDPLPFLCDHNSPLHYADGDPYITTNLHAYVWARSIPHTFAEYCSQIPTGDLARLKRLSKSLSVHESLRDDLDQPWLV